MPWMIRTIGQVGILAKTGSAEPRKLNPKP